MKTYRTAIDDRLDRIVYDHYGDTERGIVESVLEANPGLERHGLLLPPGIVVLLPPRPSATKPGVRTVTMINLWD